MQRKCLEAGDLAAYAAGKTPAARVVEFDAHVEECTKCQAALETQDCPAENLLGNLDVESIPTDSTTNGEYETAFNRMMRFIAQLDAATVSPPLPASTKVGPYRLEEPIGQGGMGIVYRAFHTKLKRHVALKMLPANGPLNPERVQRFEREMQAVAAVNHPNIVRASNADEWEGQPYLVMEYVKGLNLSELIRRTGPLSVSNASALTLQTAAGLQCVHTNGLVHRDIKPSNLILGTTGESQPSVKILDLGLAFFPDTSQLTSSGMAVGTLDYMAPEQLSSSHDVDHRADLYSLGATLFKLLTGKAPFADDQRNFPAQKMAAIANETPPRLRDYRPDAPAELCNLVDKLLAKQPDQRCAAASEIAKVLEPFATAATLDALLSQALATNCTDAQTGNPNAKIPQHQIAQNAQRRSASLGPVPVRLLALPLLLLVGVLAGVVFYVNWMSGTIRIEVNDPNVSVILDKQQLSLRDKTWHGRRRGQRHQLALKVGDQLLRIGEEPTIAIGNDNNYHLIVEVNGIAISSDTFEVMRGRENVVIIQYERRPLTKKTAPSPGSNSDRTEQPSQQTPKEMQQEWATALGIDRTVRNSLGMEFELIPPGWLRVTDGYTAELTKPFYCSKYETTVGQFDQFVAETNHPHSLHSKPADHPAEPISWNDAVSFGRWLSIREGKTYRLPTEFEWEWATRAGNEGPYFFPSTESLEDYSWSSSNSDKKTHSVGSLRPNPWGLYDVYGNVTEWMHDFHAPFPNGHRLDPSGPNEGRHHVVRGGDSGGPKNHCSHRPGHGFMGTPNFRRGFWGFRLILQIELPAPLDLSQLPRAPSERLIIFKPPGATAKSTGQ